MASATHLPEQQVKLKSPLYGKTTMIKAGIYCVQLNYASMRGQAELRVASMAEYGANMRPSNVKLAIRDVRVYDQRELAILSNLGSGQAAAAAYDSLNSGSGIGRALSRRRSYYWLVTYRGRQRRSTEFTLPTVGLQPELPETDSFKAEWDVGHEDAGHVSACPVPATAAGFQKLLIELYESGSCSLGSVQKRENSDNREDADNYSIQDFGIFKVAQCRVELQNGQGWDEWHPFVAPETNASIRGLYVRVATWVGDPPVLAPKISHQTLYPPQQHQEPRHVATVRYSPGSEQGMDGVEEEVEAASALDGEGPTTPDGLQRAREDEISRDCFGCKIAREGLVEYRHLKSLERWRTIERRSRWDRVKGLRERRRRSSASSRRRREGSELRRASTGTGSERNAADESLMAVIRELVWDGVPADLREIVYRKLCGLRAGGGPEGCAEGYYATLARSGMEESLGLGGEDNAWVFVSRCPYSEVYDEELPVKMPDLDATWGNRVAQEIELDVTRAFSEAESPINTREGRTMLRRVLRAYALRNPKVGYCQGMHFIVGLLLMVVSEETAFWGLAHLCEVVSPMCFSEGMFGTRADARALADLLKHEMSTVYEWVEDLGLELSVLAINWLIVYFINFFPGPVALRIIEVAMAEGSDILFAVMLVFLQGLEAKLLACTDLSEVHELIYRTRRATYDADALLANARTELERIRPRLSASRAWHLKVILNEERNRGMSSVINATQASYYTAVQTWLRYAISAAFPVSRLRRLLESPWRYFDRLVFEATHRLLISHSNGPMPLSPFVVDMLSLVMGWPVISRRGGRVLRDGRQGLLSERSEAVRQANGPA